MVLQAKVAVSIVEDIILLHIILSSSEGCSLDEVIFFIILFLIFSPNGFFVLSSLVFLFVE